MTISTELLVFQHLKANYSQKIVEKFCQELKFDPPGKENVHSNSVTINEIIKHFHEDSSSNRKRKNSDKGESELSEEDSESSSELSEEDSESSDDDEDETVLKETAPKKAKIDLSTTECYKCHKTGHMSRECPQTNESYSKPQDNDYTDGTDFTCYNCNKDGHMSKNCPEKIAGMSCYNCGKSGHLSRNCPDKAGGMQCYNCQGTGHLSRDCTDKNGASSKMLCYNCQTVGHMARDCTKPTVPRQQNGYSRGGGGRGRGIGSWKPRTFGTGSNSMPIGEKKSSKGEEEN